MMFYIKLLTFSFLDCSQSNAMLGCNIFDPITTENSHVIDFPSQLCNLNTKLSSGKAVLIVAFVGKRVSEITQKAV